jgi:predicted nucleic acid-binding protein
VDRYVLDSNLYIDAARDRQKAHDLAEFVSAVLPYLHLHAIVVQELLAGAISKRWQREIEEGLLSPFERRGRVVVPSFRAWKRSGEIVAELLRKGKLSRDGTRPSFLNDVLLAASCREAGVILLTRNKRDFARIAEVEPVRFGAPWPDLQKPG